MRCPNCQHELKEITGTVKFAINLHSPQKIDTPVIEEMSSDANGVKELGSPSVDTHSKVKDQHKAIGQDANKGIDNLNKKYKKEKRE